MVLHQSYYRDSRVCRYTDALTAAGVEVDVFCLREAGGLPNTPHAGARIVSLPLRHRAKGMVWFLLEYGIGVFAFSGWLLAYHLRRRYDVIHVHNVPDFLVFAALLPRALGARVVLDIHDPMPEFYLSRYGASDASLTVRLLRAEERLSARLAHLVITANLTFRENLVFRGVPPEKVIVVNNVPDPQVFDPGKHPRRPRTPDAPFTLIYTGTIAPRYGLDVAIRALPQLLPAIPQARLKIMGGGHEDYRAELTAFAERLDVAAAVEICPPVPVSQVPGYLAQADIGIYPALPDAHMSIAVPSKVLEYATMGLPIVASRLKVLEALFPESAVAFVEPGDVEGFGRAVLMLQRDAARRENLGRNAQAVMNHSHDWSHERQVYFSALNRLLAGQARLPAGT